MFLAHCARLLPSFVVLASIAPGAIAQSTGQQSRDQAIGLALRHESVFIGTADSKLRALPIGNLDYGPLFWRTTRGAVEGGLRQHLGGGLWLGAQVAFEGGRDSAADDFLRERNVPAIRDRASVGLHAEYLTRLGPAPLSLIARYRQNSSGYGARYDFRAIVGVYGSERVRAGVFAHVTGANSQWMDTYFGVSEAVAARGGLAPYTPSGGPVYSALGIGVNYSISQHWLGVLGFEGRRVLADARSSPLVRETTQGLATLGVVYRF